MVGNPRVRSAYAPQPWSRRLLSLFLALALALTLTPLPAWGDETGDAPTEALASKAFADSATTSEAPETERFVFRDNYERQRAHQTQPLFGQQWYETRTDLACNSMGRQECSSATW